MAWNESAQQGIALDSVVLNTAAPGTSFAVIGPVNMNVRPSKQLIVDMIVEAASGTSPTLDVEIQESPDNVNWKTITGGTFAQQTGTGHTRIVFPEDDGTQIVFGPLIRLRGKVGGTTPSFTTEIIITGKDVS